MVRTKYSKRNGNQEMQFIDDGDKYELRKLKIN